MWTPTTFTRDETNSSREFFLESDADSCTNQSTGTSAECSTVTSPATSWQEPLDQRQTKANVTCGKLCSQAEQAPQLGDSQAMMLNARELERLQAVLNSMVIINGVSDVGSSLLPTLACRPIDFLDVLLRNLARRGIQVNEVRLVGGAASHVMNESGSPFNDIDLMIHVDFNTMAQYLYMDGIKCVVLMSLREILMDVLSNYCPLQIPKARILDDTTLIKTYIAKMYRQCYDNLGNDNGDIWSLFSFNNFEGRNIEVKFVHTLKRQYTFSIDSWQIDLSNFLPNSKLNNHCAAQTKSNRQSALCYCLFPDINVAYHDVQKKLIRVVQPEKVRGGCFLRYGGLLYKRYRPASNKGIIEQELVMLRRFLLDFDNQTKQNEELDRYLQSHMGTCTRANKFSYLRLLESIVDHLKNHFGADNFPNAATSFASVINSKVHKFQSVCKTGNVSSVVPQLSLALNHTVNRRFCNILIVPAQPLRQPRVSSRLMVRQSCKKAFH